MMCIHFGGRHQPGASVQKAAGCSRVGGHVEGEEALHKDPLRGVLMLQRSAEVVQVSLLRGRGRLLIWGWEELKENPGQQNRKAYYHFRKKYSISKHELLAVQQVGPNVY